MMNEDLRKFIRKLFMFAPIIIFLMGSYAIYFMSGELLSIDEVYQIQQERGEGSLYGPAYTNKDVEYKVFNITKKHPETLILGTSRVMQFNPNDFPGPTYNAGGAINQIGQYYELLNFLLNSDIKPNLIVISLDQYFFNENWDYVSDAYPEYINRLKNYEGTVPMNWGAFSSDILRGKIDVVSVWKNYFKNRKYVGFNAIINQNGFLPSGSYFYGGKYIHNQDDDKNFSDTFSRIDKGRNRFEYGKNVNVRGIKKLDKFLRLCKENEIEVIAIIPPFAPSVYKKMMKTGEYDYINKIYPSIQPIFERNGYSLYDYTFMSNTKDEQYIDGFHGDKSVYHKIAQDILKRNEILGQSASQTRYTLKVD